LATPPSSTSTLFPYTTLFRSISLAAWLACRFQSSARSTNCPSRAERWLSKVAEAELVRYRLATAEKAALMFDPPNDMVGPMPQGDRKSTRLNSSHEWISYAVF